MQEDTQNTESTAVVIRKRLLVTKDFTESLPNDLAIDRKEGEIVNFSEEDFNKYKEFLTFKIPERERTTNQRLEGRSSVGVFDYLKPSEEEIVVMNDIRQRFDVLLQALESALPNGRYKSITITKLEETAMFANKSITRD